jgi:hypothetical protein
MNVLREDPARAMRLPNPLDPAAHTDTHTHSLRETRANRLFRLSRILPGQVLQTFMHSVLCGAHSASLVNPYQTIPPEEYLGFLDGLPKVGAALAEYEGRDKQKTRPPKWPGEVQSGAGSG